ncbi:MAG: hypothetical protein FJW23_17165, partial [Acidimicrobiia bacterium]|nr:hypothetical protein [Acidimicrobiia bacterium]
QRSGDRRKASGTFYTPRPVADWLVARALGPLVRDRPADEILTLRVLDPAMGSGAFLVAACRYLSEAAESARVRDGEWAVADVSEGDRIQLRRDVAQRCLYGVDLNATAVQLARLSLWLATMGRDKPLNFLDHHLVAGDSLVGATWNDVATRVPLRAARRMASLPLFDNDGFAQAAAAAVPIRLQMAVERDDNAATVRRKEALLDRLPAVEGAARWKTVFDLWCACWFWPDDRPPTAGVWGDLVDHVTRGQAALPAAALTAWLESSRHAAAAHTFLHWELVFPEVFFDERGQRRAEAGFDAVIGNPPWDVVRADSGEPALRADRRRAAAQLTRFARDAGVYRCRSTAHANRYQLFVDRALQLTRPGGRLGLVLPSGALTDSGASALRRLLFDRASVDELTGLDNRHGIFPIHRGLRFVLVSAEHGRPTERSRCRFGVSRLDDLPAGPSTAPGVNRSTALRASPGVVVTRALLERLSGPEDLAVPEVGSALDLAIVERISATVPRLDAPDGWGARFGRELHASDDRGAFVASGRRQLGRPVLEGKHIEPFRADLGRCSAALPVSSRQARRIPRRARLAYRDVAAATNRLTLIASVVPAHAVTTHTLHVLRTTMSVGSQQALCALLNSFVANYLVRLRVSSHLPAAMVAALRVPVPAGALLVRLATLADGLARSTGEIESTDGYAEIQARSARAFGVSRDELAHILDTFPLISATVRDRCLQRFGDLPPLDGEPRSSDHAKLRCR